MSPRAQAHGPGAMARTPASSASPRTRTTTLSAVTCWDPETPRTRLALGGVRVSKPNACDPPRRRSPAAQRWVTVLAPGRTRTVFTRRVTGLPGRSWETEVGTRDPPPADGMQPMNGRKVAAAAARPAYVPRKTTEREVVIPGFTGLPREPMNPTSIARTLSRASRPPTTCARGHVSWNSTRCRGIEVDAGTTTQGPATGTHTMSPSHSSAPPAGAATARATPATTRTHNVRAAFTGLSGRAPQRSSRRRGEARLRSPRRRR